MPKKTRSKYKAKILEKLRVLNAERDMLCQILKECQEEGKDEEEQEDK